MSSVLDKRTVQGAPSKCSRAHGNSSPSKMYEMYRWLFNFTSEGTKTRGDLPVAVKAAVKARTWILCTFRCGPSSRARPAELLMILSRIWRPNCRGNGPRSPKKFCVPRAMPFKRDWNKLLKIKEAILNKGQMNRFACYLAISCSNKCAIFFVFIREPGQNARCHKFGGPCTVVVCVNTNPWLFLFGDIPGMNFTHIRGCRVIDNVVVYYLLRPLLFILF